uniref:Uncharacterized protein TCIL3000_9_5790 n=1 Tax=Trypanosoma congolense (strain IL3000) TaxID=1068625 RepID=G0UUV7_TRYCI|nr:unnamed protein product [Trypanosoma congolense IL3000]
MTTITSYLSVRRSDDPVVSEQVGSGGDGCQARSLLEVLGKVLSRCFSIASGTGSGELETVSTEALRKLISAKGFWGAVLDEMSRALLDCDEYRLKGACMSCHGSLRTIPQESCVLKALQGELKRAAFSPTPPGEGTRGERWLKHIAFLLGHASLCGHSAKPVVRHPKTRLSEGDVDVLARDRAWRIVQGLRGHISSLDAATCASKMCFSKWLQDEQKRLARKRSSGLQ